jgi:spore germination protein KA
VAPAELTDYVNQHLLPYYATLRVVDMVEMQRWVMMSKMILLIDGSPVGLVLDAEHTPVRSITEPVNESVVWGPRDSFVESLRMNTALIRSHLGDPKLKSENYILGRRSNTLVTLMFVEDLAKPEVVQEVRRRLSRIDIDAILDANTLQELIQDQRYSLFPLMKRSERPDKVTADLLEGRFALIVDGSPQVLTAPSVFIEFVQSAEDYYLNPIIVTFLRLLRFVALFICTIVPGLYVAVTTFHQEMIPVPLIYSIAGTRESVPFPAFFEAFLLLVGFELLVEAGIRLPRAVGGAVNIVGALILGQAAVQAGIVSPILVIVIGLTAIANFAVSTTYQLSIMLRVPRLVYLITGSMLGLYGMAVTFLFFMIHMTSLRSFGVPYLEPLAPLRVRELNDTFYRVPVWRQRMRPGLVAEGDLKRNDSPPPHASVESTDQMPEKQRGSQ